MSENIIQNHAVLLKDKVRMEVYKKAIEETVKEGDTVLDIGCGLGILSFLALQSGARHVHAVDVEPTTLSLARTIAKKNGLDKKITLHKSFSSKLRLKDRVDVIISELFGNLGLNENVLPVLIDARDRLLKKGGRMVPEGLKVFFAPCEHKDWEFTAKLLNNVYGFDLLPDVPAIDLGFPSVIVKNSELLAEPKTFSDINFLTAVSPVVSNVCVFNVVRDGNLTGFAGWFSAMLTKNVSFSTSPTALTTHWKQGFLPLRTMETVRAGQKIKLSLEMMPDPSGLNSIVGYHYEII